MAKKQKETRSRDDRFREKIETDLFKLVDETISGNDWKNYELFLREMRQRYDAKRSIAGLKGWGPDPEEFPKDEPWDGCSDFGFPIERIIINELVPNVMEAHFGMTPLTDTKALSDEGFQPAGKVDDFLDFELRYRAKLERIRTKTVRSAYKYREGIERIRIEKKERHVSETRLYLARGEDEKAKYLYLSQDRPVEIMDREDITAAIVSELTGEDPRSTVFRMATRKGIPQEKALRLAGIQVNQEDETVVFAQMVSTRALTVADWRKKRSYRLREVDVSEDVHIRSGITVTRVAPIDFLRPLDTDSDDLMELPWCGVRYGEPLSWFIGRVGDGKDGFYEEVVEELVELFTGDEDLKKAKPEVWEIWARFVLEDEDKDSDDYMKEMEIVAWFCPKLKDHKLLGWCLNPHSRFPSEYIRPLFCFRVREEDDRQGGLCVPETVQPARDLLDAHYNQRVDMQTIANNPPIIMTPDAFYKGPDGKMTPPKYGPGEIWVRNLNEEITALKLAFPGIGNMADEEKLLMLMRFDWGASELYSGITPKLESNTKGEIEIRAAGAGRMFMETVKSLSRTADLQYEFIKNLYRFSKELEGQDFADRDGARQQLTRELLDGQIYIRSRRMATEAERIEKIKAVQMIWKFLGDSGSPIVQMPAAQEMMLTLIRDLLNLESMKLPKANEIQAAQGQMKEQQQKKQILDQMVKALQAEKNKGNRNLIRRYLQASGAAEMMGLEPESGQ